MPVTSPPLPAPLRDAQDRATERLVAAAPELIELGEIFAGAGFELAAVGGCVRDSVLERIGTTGQDIDLTTNASPEQTLELLGPWAEAVWDVGIKWGTVGARKADRLWEITTFRADVYDGETRKPDVTFGASLSDDLVRRDFTINAMAVRVPELEFVDEHRGLIDLAAGRLRTPGAPADSFRDDPLRMRRAARFGAQLDLVIEGDTYPIRAIIVQNGEPLVNYGGSRLAYEAFTSEELELLVVMDHWLTPTAQLADYVLPATDFLERPELSMRWGFTRMFSVGQQSVAPLFERRDDYDLWAGIGRRLLDPLDWPEQVDEMLDRFLAPSGRTHREWGESGASCYLPENRTFQKYREHGFATASGKVELIPSLFEQFGIDPRPVYTGPPYARPDVDDEAAYPLQMLTGSRVLEFMGSTMRQSKKMLARHPEPLVQIHPETAATYNIADGDWVEIARPEGAIRQRATVTDAIRPGTINLAGYWWDPKRRPGADLSGVWEANGNAITPYDPKLSSFVGDQPLRGLRCSIRHVNAPVG